MITSGFFDATSYDEETGKWDKEYTAEQFGKLFSLFFTNGIFANYGEQFAVTAAGNMVVNVGTGFAFINGAWVENDSTYQITLASNMSDSTRVDGIFLTKDTVNGEITIEYRSGDVTPISTETLKELLLAEITVASNATSITQSSIVDKRPFDTCGFVSAAIQQLTVEQLYVQFTQEFTEWMAQRKEDFDIWFELIKGQLSTDAAGNLQLQLNEVSESTELGINEIKSSLPTYMYDSTTGILNVTIPETNNGGE